MTDIPPEIVLNAPSATHTTPELSPALAGHLRSLTPARIALRRSGSSLATPELLDFQLAHARARDAVHAPLQPASLLAALRTLTGTEPLGLHSAAPNRQTYLQRPDLGRKLDEASRKLLASHGTGNELAIVLADGLSSLAVERHALPLLTELVPCLAALRLAPIVVVEQARVAVGDEIAYALSAEMVVVLIGERPGLSSPDSLGAYITWNPSPGSTTDAQRNCISNIRTEGLGYANAAARLLFYIEQARSLRTTGTTLKDPESDTETLQLPVPIEP